MGNRQVLGLLADVTATAGAIEHLGGLGISAKDITVMSDVEYAPEALGLPRARGRLGWIVAGGALLGLATALFLTVGVFLLYPVPQGGQPTIPVPPSLIVIFEVTMLGTMWSAFFGFLLANRLPPFRRQAYDPRVSAGEIGLVIHAEESRVAEVERALKQAGAHDVQVVDGEPEGKVAARKRLALAAGAILVALVVVGVLFWYGVLHIPFPSNMVEQASLGYEEGPRLAAPAEAVPVQGPVLIADQPASEPVAASAASLQRGQVLFDIDCALCHGQDGTGTGPIGDHFAPKPADLRSDEVQGLSEAEIFMVITQGQGVMPSLAENLEPAERWDVVNHVRSLKK
jgi:mono/diheme cytochrome c family protein